MQNMIVIIKKQLRDTVKNKTILIQFILFPIMTMIMENLVKIDDMPEAFFVKMFAVMYIGMAPLTAAAAIISEEKEKNTLRVLMMTDMKPWQYLIGVGVYIWIICMLGAAVMSSCIKALDRPFFMVVMGMGFIISTAAGACIGIFSKNQMMATSLNLPCMIVLSFAPMLSMFNESIKKFSAVFYTQQLKMVFDGMSFKSFSGSGIAVLCANAAICAIIFVVAYRKRGLE